jgi:hypothetical protein
MQRADHEQALEAARRWIAEHGRYPQQHEWEHRAPGRPTMRTIKRRWGWDQLMTAAAGAGARSPKLEMRRQRRLELLLTLRRARQVQTAPMRLAGRLVYQEGQDPRRPP